MNSIHWKKKDKHLNLKIGQGTGIVVQMVKLLPGVPASRVPAAPPLIQLPAKEPENAVEDVPRCMGPCATWETWNEFCTAGISLA